MFFLWPVRDEFGVKKLPIVNYTIIFINVCVFFLYGLSSSYQEIVNRFGFIPDRFSWLTIFTSMFLHGGIMHLIGNMWYLYLMGDNIEDRWGHFPYLLFYLFSGVIAAVFYGTFTYGQARSVPSIGASGAISGVLGAYLVLFPRSNITFWYSIFAFYRVYSGTFDIFAWFWISIWFVQQLVGMLVNTNVTAVSGVAFGAHVGGFLAGIAIGLLTKIFQQAMYIRNVASGKNALSRIVGEIPMKMIPFDDQVELFKKEKEIGQLIQNKDEREAAILFGECIRKYPDVSIPPFYDYKFAEILSQHGLIDEAIIAYKRFIRKNPFSKLADNALYNLGKIYLERGEIRKAKECFLQIVLFYPYSELIDAARYALKNIKDQPALEG
ncbi:MAG: rhomboid family intramembrane serine protease [Candidatus Ratteibacteria bacterium]